jgi:hypothetical protein
MKHLSPEIQNELHTLGLEAHETDSLLLLEEAFLPRNEFVQNLEQKIFTAPKKLVPTLTPSPWQFFFTRSQSLVSLILFAITAPLVFLIVKNSYPPQNEGVLPTTISNTSEQSGDASSLENNVGTESISPTEKTSPAPLPTQSKMMLAPSAPTFEKVRLQAAKDFHTTVENVSVISYEEKTWPDACLGISSPLKGCAEVVTPGFLVTIQVGTSTALYHTDTEEKNIRRE